MILKVTFTVCAGKHDVWLLLWNTGAAQATWSRHAACDGRILHCAPVPCDGHWVGHGVSSGDHRKALGSGGEGTVPTPAVSSTEAGRGVPTRRLQSGLQFCKGLPKIWLIRVLNENTVSYVMGLETLNEFENL